MKTAFLFLWASAMGVFLASTMGCEKTTVAGTNGRKLTLMKPANQTLARGKTSDVKVSIDRTKLDAPITVEVAQLPRGVQVTNADKTIPRDKDSVTLTLQAAPDADLVKDHRVTVTAKAPADPSTPMADLEATEIFLVTVKE